MRFRRGRMSARDQMLAGLTAQRFYAAGVADDDPRKAENTERLEREAASIAPKRHRVKRPVDGKPPQPSEAQVLKAVLQYLNAHSLVHRAWRQQAGALQLQGGYGERDHYMRLGPPGVSDVIGILKGGRMLCVEVKSPTGKVLAHQQAFIDDMTRAGALAFIARSVEDCEAALARRSAIP